MFTATVTVAAGVGEMETLKVPVTPPTAALTLLGEPSILIVPGNKKSTTTRYGKTKTRMRGKSRKS